MKVTVADIANTIMCQLRSRKVELFVTLNSDVRVLTDAETMDEAVVIASNIMQLVINSEEG